MLTLQSMTEKLIKRKPGQSAFVPMVKIWLAFACWTLFMTLIVNAAMGFPISLPEMASVIFVFWGIGLVLILGTLWMVGLTAGCLGFTKSHSKAMLVAVFTGLLFAGGAFLSNQFNQQNLLPTPYIVGVGFVLPILQFCFAHHVGKSFVERERALEDDHAN